MMKNWNLKTRRIFLIVSFFVFLLSLTSCRTAGDLAGNLKVDDPYVQAGNYKVTKGELWDELKWFADDEVASKFEEVIVSEYFDKVESIMSAESTLTGEEKELFSQYTERLTAYVIQDVYNFAFSTKTLDELAKDIESVKHYDKIKLLNTYADEMYSNYNVTSIDGKTIKTLCEEEQYMTLAKAFKDVYYTSLAKEL